MRALRVPAAFESPLLVGSVILAVGIVGVLLSYNANKGLPFVPTYQIFARVPDAAELTEANSEVRIRGIRVGLVKEIRATPPQRGQAAYARLTLALDRTVAELPADTRVDIRPRSVLGAKYLELVPGRSRRTIPQGGTLPVSQALPVVEFDEAFNVFDRETSEGLRNSITVAADALAGRGAAINQSVVLFRRLLAPLQSVSATLADPATDLDGFIRGAAGASRALVPVSGRLGSLIDHAATTLAALDAVRPALADSIDELPPTEIVATRAIRRINPVLDDAAYIARAIRPGSRFIPPSTFRLARALEVGTPVLERTPPLSSRLREALDAVEDLARRDNVNELAEGLLDTMPPLRSLLSDLAPAQLQCNVFGLYGTNLTQAVTEGDEGGTWLAAMLMLNVPEMLQSPEPVDNLHLNELPRQNAQECEAGNEPYRPGQQIGNPGGQQSGHVPDTPR